MILPFLAGFVSPRQAPATYLLLVFNLIVFIALAVNSPRSNRQLEEFARDKSFAEIQGRLFAQFIMQKAARYPARYIAIAEQAIQERDPEKEQLLGLLALRDSYFFKEGQSLQLTADPIELSWWRKKATEFQRTRNALPSYGLGITETESEPTQWLTYQFTHNDFIHFVSNMLVFLIFGVALERVIGSLALVTVFIGAGTMSALVFLLIDNPSAVPLIGASGAVSGVISLFCFLYWRTGVRHLYFLFIPFRGYMGMIYLPAWIIFLLWFIADLAGYLATPREFGGVAYSAHLGGELCGLLVGFIFLALRKLSGRPIQIIDEEPLTGRPFSRLG